MISKQVIALAFTSISIISVIAQTTPILLKNPSLEDFARRSKPPIEWYFCGPSGESPPDVHPCGSFEVNQKPYHGNTFIGMVVRDNNSWESIGQQLSQPLQAGQCYRFSFYASRSGQYVSYSREAQRVVNFNTPSIIRIWGGDQYCSHLELLAESPPIVSIHWEVHAFEFTPSEDHSHFIIEAYYQENLPQPYPGNVLLDKLSPIIPIDCDYKKSTIDSPSITAIPIYDWESYKAFAQKIGPKIQWLETGLQLEYQFFQDQQGVYHQANLPFWRLLLAFQKLPDKRLFIALPTINSLDFQYKKLDIEQHLLHVGISKDRYTIKKWKKSFKKKDWLWPFEDTGIAIRLY